MPSKEIKQHREYCRDHYRRNKQYYLDKQRKRRQKLKRDMKSYKESYPCTDCKRFYPSYVMDFDHVKGKKKFLISTNYAEISKARLKKEIAKCELVCSNCHRIRTHNRSKK